jgi:hypothetical protein
LRWLWLAAKPVPVLCLVLWVLGAPKSAYRNRLAGAILFALSDTLIAFDRFHSPVAGARLPIILLYWAGQVGIAMSARLR